MAWLVSNESGEDQSTGTTKQLVDAHLNYVLGGQPLSAEQTQLLAIKILSRGMNPTLHEHERSFLLSTIRTLIDNPFIQ